MATQTENTKPGGSTKKYVLIGIGAVTGIALAGFFIYRHSQQNAITEDSGEDELDNALKTTDNSHSVPQQPQVTNSSGSSSYQTTDSTFPLRAGSRGKLVVELQNALIRAYCKSALPKYGADGSWGKEVTKALIDHQHPTVITEADLTKIKNLPACGGGGILDTTKPPTPVSIVVTAANAGATATALYAAIKANSFSTVVPLLQRMKSPADYKLVGDLFKQIPWDGLRRFTLVTAVFTTFIGADQKKTLTDIFKGIGLKLDPKTGNWSNPLSGINANVETTEATVIWDGNGVELEVPAHTLLGEKLSQEMDIIRFRTADGWDMYVLAEHVAER